MSDAALARVAAPESRFAAIRQLVLASVRSAHTRRAYAKALDDFLAWDAL